MILSASGWRGVFAPDGEESAAAKISAENEEFVRAAARTFAAFLREKHTANRAAADSVPAGEKIVVITGMDTRPTGPAIARAVNEEFIAAGCIVHWLGIAAAPEIMAYARVLGGEAVSKDVNAEMRRRKIAAQSETAKRSCAGGTMSICGEDVSEDVNAEMRRRKIAAQSEAAKRSCAGGTMSICGEAMREQVCGGGFCYVSASHNPIGHNGLKFGLLDGGVLGAEDAAKLLENFEAGAEGGSGRPPKPACGRRGLQRGGIHPPPK